MAVSTITKVVALDAPKLKVLWQQLVDREADNNIDCLNADGVHVN